MRVALVVIIIVGVFIAIGTVWQIAATNREFDKLNRRIENSNR